MIYLYSGSFPYNKSSIVKNAPESIGVYYCGSLNERNILEVLYVGRAKGDEVTIRGRLLDHLRRDNWPDVTHFGYRVCTTESEAEILEADEIQRLRPKYNVQGKNAY